ncbi:MAG: hypothetical protein IJ007_06050 [Oscillospiraceae bacterium]|nr:hypothetical protein [Oscillospiraceae bacterium]
MASSFMGLYVQREALVAAQKALDITGNNLSNANTEGYSRQRVDVCSVSNTGHNLLYNTSVSMAGQGVDQVGVGQYRDALIDEKVRGYTTTSSEYTVKGDVMLEVETVLDNIEAEDAGFAVNLAKFKEALQSFSVDNADRQEIANVVQQAAQSMVQQLNYMNGRIDEISRQTLEDAKGSVTQVNTILKSMAELNEQITTSYINMGYISADMGNYVVDNDYGPLELKDQMNLLIDQLSQFGNVNVEEQTNGSFTISFANQVVVHNDKYAQIAMTEENPAPFDLAYVVTSCGEYDKLTDSYSGLMNSKEWTKITDEYGTSENYIRESNINIVDINENDTLTGGSLKSYYEVYNGAGVYAQEQTSAAAEQYLRNVENTVTEANDLLKSISERNQEVVDKSADLEAAQAELKRLMDLGGGDPDEATSEAIANTRKAIIVLTKEIASAKKNRTEAVSDLSEICEITTADEADGTVTVNTATGVNLVTGNTYGSLSLAEEDPAPGEMVINATGTDGTTADITANTAGSLKTNVDNFNDPSKTSTIEEYRGIEYYRGMLNGLAKTMTEEFNDIYEEFGFGIFSYADDAGNNDFYAAAGNLRLSEEWLSDPTLIAQPEQFGGNPEEVMDELNNDYIHKMLGVFQDNFKYGFTADDGEEHYDNTVCNFEDFVSHISDNLGTQLESNNKLLSTIDIMLDSSITSRDEIMGVSINEEGVNMMNYQKWYNAIARMVTTLDQALDKVINGMGIVGL